MRANVKPLTHWLIYRGYSVRFGRRRPELVQGILTTPEGDVPFDYAPQTMTIHLPDRAIAINQYGWEIGPGKPQEEEQEKNEPN